MKQGEIRMTTGSTFKHRTINGNIINIGSICMGKKLKRNITESLKIKVANEDIQKVVALGEYKGFLRKEGLDGHLFEHDMYCVTLNKEMTKILKLSIHSSPQLPSIEQQNKQDDGSASEADKTQKKEGRQVDETMKTMNDMLHDLKSQLYRWVDKLSDLDKKISQLYHDIEINNFNAYQGYQYSKNLQTLLRKRRLVKQEMEKISANVNHFEDMQESIKKVRKNLEKYNKSCQEYSGSWNVSI